MAKKFKDLTVSDFPGVEPLKFEEWKNLSLKVNMALILGLPLLLGLILVFQIVIGGAIGGFLPLILWFGYMFLYVSPLSSKAGKLGKSLGIDRTAVKKALSK